MAEQLYLITRSGADDPVRTIIDGVHACLSNQDDGISDNTRAFWSLANARQVLGYEPEDDAEVKFASLVQALLVDTGAGGRLGS